MSKLKTLKDLKCACGDKNCKPQLMWVDELKTEAIKWVKHCNCNKKTFVCRACVRFKVFFNMDDLK